MKQIKTSSIVLLTGFLCMLAFVACSGGGGTGPSDPAAAPPGNGTVALFLKDGPADDYTNIFVTITKVALIPEENENADPEEAADTEKDQDTAQVVIFESETGEVVDFLRYKYDPYLFLVDENIPAGRYDKIRLWVSDVQAVGGPCETMEVKLPSGKIDLNPKGGFEVVPGEALAIELDLDLDKSIQMHEAGNSGKCIFRPVIFVDIYDQPAFMPACPGIISGTIQELVTGGDSEPGILGFKMQPATAGVDKPLLTVMLDNAVIFDGSGHAVDMNTLQTGDTVNVRGRLNSEGILDASLVVTGDVASVHGIVLSGVDSEYIFQLAPAANQVVIDDPEIPLNVKILEGAFVRMGCDDEVDLSAVQEGMEALVVGKIDSSGNFLAVLVLLHPKEVSGMLLSIVPEAGGSELTVNVNTDGPDTEEVHVFLPEDVAPHVKGDGLLPLDLLTDIVECDKRPPVEIRLVPGEFNIAAALAVVPFELTGMVTAEPDPMNNLMTLDVDGFDTGLTVQIYAYATILDDTLIGIEDIRSGSTISSYGIESCDENITQIAFVVSVQ